MSPCERTMIWLRGLGFTVDKVERRLPRGFVTVDFMGFADILAIRPGMKGVLAVQATTGGHLQERVHKVQAEPRANLWLGCENLVWGVGWVLRKDNHRKLWAPRVVIITQSGASELSESAIIAL